MKLVNIKSSYLANIEADALAQRRNFCKDKSYISVKIGQNSVTNDLISFSNVLFSLLSSFLPLILMYKISSETTVC